MVGSSTRRGRILVVDDDPYMGSALRRTLSSEHDVTVSHSGVEALALFRAGERYDVFLCDLLMPEMSGIELHAQLLAVAPDQAATMIFLTGGTTLPGAREFLARVPNTRLEKPFDLKGLRALVRERVG